MNEISATTIFLVILFILPGFLAFSIHNSLYKKSKPISEIEVTYKSLLYSAGMYATLMIIFVLLKKSLTTFILTHLIWFSFMMIIFSIFWGIAIFLISTHDLLYKILKILKLTGRVTPPNLYAAIFDPNYQPKAAKGYWIIFPKNFKRDKRT